MVGGKWHKKINIFILIFKIHNLREAEYDMTRTGVKRIKGKMKNWGFTSDQEVVFLSGNVDEIVSRCHTYFISAWNVLIF